MPEDIFLDNTGSCFAVVAYDYHPYTEYLMEQYSLHNNPKPEWEYKAWDYVIRQLAAQTDVLTTSFLLVEDPDNPGEVLLDYSVPDLAGAVLIIDVSIEGQGINESDEATVNIDLENGTLVFGLQGLQIGARVKITYKK